MRWHLRLRSVLSSHRTAKKNRPARRVLLQLEELETRALLSASSVTAVAPVTSTAGNEIVQPLLTVDPQAGRGAGGSSAQLNSTPTGHSPTQIQQAYGFSSLPSTDTGAGETIAIVDAYNDPTLLGDLAHFDTQYSLPGTTTTAGNANAVQNFLTVVNQTGGSALPASNSGWALEISLDVEWAHAMAPGANIVLVEANSSSMNNLMTAVDTASKKGNIVSMSWGGSEFSGESSYDSHFQAPGVTYVAAAGDSSAYAGPIYPATSPYVLAVGGTTLSSSGETAWSDGGGGAAAYEGEPSYQYNQASIGSPDAAVYNFWTGTYSYYSSRLSPDVAYAADPGTKQNPIGFAVYDSTPDQGQAGWIDVGGTSAGAPQWSAIVARADQYGSTHLNTYQVATTLYNTLGTTNYNTIFNDITTGSNGYSAGTGYDLATGLGTPKVNALVPFLADTNVSSTLPSRANFLKGSGTGGAAFSSPFGFFATPAQGGGLYSSSGSIGIPGGTGNSTGGAPVVSAATSPASAPPLVFSSAVASPGTPAISASTPGNNSLVFLNTPSQGPSFASAAASTLFAASTNATVAPNNDVFGASGLTGSASAWRLSSLGLPGQAIEDLALGLSGDGQENGNNPSAQDSSGTSTDASEDALSVLDVTAPPLLEGDAGGEGGEAAASSGDGGGE